jgi:superfamily I DNA/RNA helicase
VVPSLVAFELQRKITARLTKSGRRTFIQIASDAAEAANASGRVRYQHILVDEGQDLHPAHWRLLQRSSLAGADLFIVGDAQQADL